MSEVQADERKAAEVAAKKGDDESEGKGEGVPLLESVEEHSADDVAAWEREYAEEQSKLKAQNEDTERHFAEMEKEIEAEESAARERGDAPAPPPGTEDRPKGKSREPVSAAAAMHAYAEAKVAAPEAAPVYRAPINWGKPVAVVLFLLLIAGLGLLHVISFEGYIPQFEKLASGHLQQPVKIKALHLSLVPLPHWRLDGVSIGGEGQLNAERVKAVPELGSMFGEKKAFRSIELESPVLSEEGLIALLFGKPQGQNLKVASIIAKNAKLNSKTIILPVLDAKISMSEDGMWKNISLETADRKTNLLLESKDGGAQFEVETNVFATPFGPAFILEGFSAKGSFSRDQLRLSEFKGGIYGGFLSGNANLKWGADWTMGGAVSARAMDPGAILPGLLEEGVLEGKATYSMRAKSYDELFLSPRLEGSFSVLKGTLVGVDLARLLQGGGLGGKTNFPELTGSFVREGGKTQAQQIRLATGPVSLGGSVDVDARKNLNGRFVVELKSPVAQARANLTLAGTIREPRFSR